MKEGSRIRYVIIVTSRGKLLAMITEVHGSHR